MSRAGWYWWVLLAATAAPFPAQAADEVAPASIVGTWLGVLDVGAAKLRLGFEVTSTPPEAIHATLVSIDQGTARIAAKAVQIDEQRVRIEFPALGAAFEGSLRADPVSLEGSWSQGGGKWPLRLVPVESLPAVERPQQPKPPFPYRSEDVTFPGGGPEVTLAGTLTTPEGDDPVGAVVLVTGSGPQDRDETLFGHKPFLLLADTLTRRGVAVLRYDDRGVGESTGDFGQATTEDFTADALAALRYLAARGGIDATRVGVGGHSEGSMVAVLAAARAPEEVAFIVLLAPPAVDGVQIILTQGAEMERRMGMPPDAVEKMKTLRRDTMRLALDVDDEKQYLTKLKERTLAHTADAPGTDEEREALAKSLGKAFLGYRTPWFRRFLAYDPVPDLRRVRCPVLALIGSKDVQVLPDVNLPPLRAALAAAPTDDVTIEELDGLNHLFQTAKTGLVGEYATIAETIAPSALSAVADWVVGHAAPVPAGSP